MVQFSQESFVAVYTALSRNYSLDAVTVSEMDLSQFEIKVW